MNDSIQTLRQQLLELKSQRESGALDGKAYAARKAPLERRLVHLVLTDPDAGPATRGDAEMQAAPRTTQPNRWLWAGAAGVAVLVAAGGYLWTAAPAGVGQPPEGFAATGQPGADAVAPPHALDQAQIVAMTDRLAERLKTQPDDADGWSMLGRSYVTLGRNADALSAYQQAIKLRPDDANTLADYADALAVKNGRELAGEPMRHVERALQLDPDNLKALSLAGTAAFNRKDYALAVQHWDRAARVGPPDSPMTQQARSGAAEARERAKLPPAGGSVK